jgi:hypothetical protein
MSTGLRDNGSGTPLNLCAPQARFESAVENPTLIRLFLGQRFRKQLVPLNFIARRSFSS